MKAQLTKKQALIGLLFVIGFALGSAAVFVIQEESEKVTKQQRAANLEVGACGLAKDMIQRVKDEGFMLAAALRFDHQTFMVTSTWKRGETTLVLTDDLMKLKRDLKINDKLLEDVNQVCVVEKFTGSSRIIKM